MARGLLTLFLLACAPVWAQEALPPGTWVIERLYPSGLVRLMERSGGHALLLRAAHLPRGAKEGDVLNEGRVDPALRDSILRAQAAVHARALRGGFSLTGGGARGSGNGGGDTRPLTAEGER